VICVKLKPAASRTLRPSHSIQSLADIDQPERPHYIAASARESCRNRSRCREAHLSAQQTRSQAPPWVPGTDGDGGRPPGSGSATRQGPQAFVGLSFGLKRPVGAKSVRTAVIGLRFETLKSRADFLRIAAARRSAAGPTLVLQAARRPAGFPCDADIRIGFTASRKVGNSVTRNRAKRRLRAAAAEVLAFQGKVGTDYVLIARASTAHHPFSELVADLASALRRIEYGGSSLRNEPKASPIRVPD
jgi:ribonuclease P protein component